MYTIVSKKYPLHRMLEMGLIKTHLIYDILYQKFFEYSNMFWLVNAYHGYIISYVDLTFTNIKAKLSIYDGPKTYYNILNATLQHSNNPQHTRIPAATRYFSSLVKLDVFWKSSHSSHLRLIKLRFKKIFTKIRRVNISEPISVRGSIEYPLQEVIFIEPIIQGFVPISFEMRNFSGWSEGGCQYGGYILIQNILAVSKNENLVNGPYCNITGSNYPLVTNNGLQNLTLGKVSMFLLFYAYSPLYTIDLRIITRYSPCEDIINPAKICRN